MSVRRLPVRPDLDQLKHQAKDLLRELRVGNSDAKLSDAQLALAREYQASSWTRLSHAVQLADAIWLDDLNAVRILVTGNPHLIHEDVLIRTDSNWGPPMTYAANLGRNRIIGMLRGLGATDLETAMDRAALQGQIETGTPLGGTTLLHMCVDYDEIEIARWLLDRGMDPNVRSAVGASGFGGYTPLFATVVSQPNFWMNYNKRGPFVAPFTELLLERGADPNVRASIWKRLHPGHGDPVRHDYRDVTALSWGQRFHAPIFVSEPAMRLIEAAGGTE